MATPPQHRIRSAALLVMMSLITGSVSLFAQDADSSARIRKAREFFINGTTLQIQGNRHAEAILEFQQALRYDSSAVTLTAIARSFLELRKLDMAMEYAQEAIERDSSSRDTWELIAEIEVMRGRYDEGIAAYEHILSLNPTKRNLYTLGRLYEPRNAAKAIDVFERLVAIEPDEGVFLRLADLYERKRNVKGVLRSLQRAQALDPLDAQVAARTAELYVHEGLMAELRTLLSAWKGRDLDIDRSARVWGVALTGIIEDTLVRALYSDDIRLILDECGGSFGNVWPVMLLSGTVALRLEDTTRARKFFELAVVAQGARMETYLEVGRMYLINHMPAAAEEFLSAGLQKYPNDARMYFLRGSAHMELDRSSEAATYFQRAIAIDPTFVDAWVQLGLLYDQMGKLDSSDYSYEQALRLEPDHALANNNFAYSLAVRGISLDRARSMAWRAVQSEPQTASFLDTYAYILYRLDELERAKTYIERAIHYGGNATHYEHYGDILEALNDLDGALRAWRMSVEKDPSRTRVKLKIDKYR